MVKGSLLLLQPWSSELAIDEVKLQFCAFWVQVHNLPRQFMTTTNAIRIGKGIGKILELDHNGSSGLISRPFIRFKIEINSSLPLALGFFIPCEGTKPRWISFKYERLDEYCSSCGLIGHVKKFCPAPQEQITPDKYKKSIRAAPYVRPRLVSKPQQEDSNSGVSSAASMGNSSSCFSSPCNTFGHIIPRNQLDSHGSSNNLLSLHHVESSNNLVPSQSSELFQQWDLSSFQHSIGRYTSKGKQDLISLKSNNSDWPYPPLNDPTCLPYFSQFMPTTTQLAPCSTSKSHKKSSHLDFFFLLNQDL